MANGGDIKTTGGSSGSSSSGGSGIPKNKPTQN